MKEELILSITQIYSRNLSLHSPRKTIKSCKCKKYQANIKIACTLKM